MKKIIQQKEFAAKSAQLLAAQQYACQLLFAIIANYGYLNQSRIY